MSACDRQCNSQCDNCHTLDNCVEATRQYGDLLLCQSCREKYPVRQPWRLDPETGEYIDNYTVGNYVIDNPGPVAVGDVELDWGPVFAADLAGKAIDALKITKVSSPDGPGGEREQ